MEYNALPWLVDKAVFTRFSVQIGASTASGPVFVSDGYYRLRDVWESHSVKSDSGTLQVEVLASGDDADGGTDQLSSALNLATTADTPQQGTLIEPPTTMGPGEALGIVVGGTMTNLVNCCVTLTLEKLQKGIV